MVMNHSLKERDCTFAWQSPVMSSIEIASKTCKNRLKNEHFSSLHKTLAESLTEAALSHFHPVFS
jgi:hypothetical protein